MLKSSTKITQNQGLFVWVEKGLKTLRFLGGEESPLCDLCRRIDRLWRKGGKSKCELPVPG
jgi:hypothetical protein